MADENILPRDQNHVTSAGFENSLIPGDVRPGQIIVSTGRIKVDIAGTGVGDVVGPASSTDNAVARFDGTTGKIIQNSTVIISDAGAITGVTDLIASGTLRANTSIVLEEPGAGTDTITIQAPTAVTASYTLTLPVDDGAADQFLQTNGSGVLTWATSTATTPASPLTSVQYNNAGSFGGANILYDGDFLGAQIPIFKTSDDEAAHPIGIVAGNSTVEGNPGGALFLLPGNGFGSGAGGDIFIGDGNNLGGFGNAGDTGNGGNTSIFSGLGGATSGSGGSISLTAGSAQGGDSDGGGVEIYSGSPTGTGIARRIGIFGATSTNSDGGAVEIGGGSSDLIGGQIIILGGAGLDSGTGGGVGFGGGLGGTMTGDTDGGEVEIGGGNAGHGDGEGGDVTISAGDGMGSGDGGTVVISGGVGGNYPASMTIGAGTDVTTGQVTIEGGDAVTGSVVGGSILVIVGDGTETGQHGGFKVQNSVAAEGYVFHSGVALFSDIAGLAENDSGAIFTNEGETTLAVFTLPTAAVGLAYTFIVQDADGIRVTADIVDTIRIGASVTASAGHIDSTTIGSSVTIVAINSGEWMATALVGTWSAT